jgi:DNA-binding response OmpR family regulator
LSDWRSELGFTVRDEAATESRSRAIALIAELIEALTDGQPQVETIDDAGTFEFGKVRLDPRMREATRDGAVIELSPLEYELLLALALRSGAPVSREVLASTVWHGKLPQNSRTIDQHIGQLRKKVEDKPSNPAYIVTVPKYGYRLLGNWVRAR